MNKRAIWQVVAEAVMYSFLGGAAAAFAIIFAVRIVAPALRYTFGNPYGYDFDYTTAHAWIYAASIRISCIALVFCMVGLLLGRPRNTSTTFLAVAVANPFSIFLGLFCCDLLKHFVDVSDSSFGTLGYVAIALSSPLLLAPFVLLGRGLANKLTPRSS